MLKNYFCALNLQLFGMKMYTSVLVVLLVMIIIPDVFSI